MRVAYFDCFSGVSGDMFVGALLDLGAPLEKIEMELAKLHLPPFDINIDRVTRGGLAATKFNVRTEERGLVRTWSNVRTLLEESDLSVNVRKRSIAAFERLAAAEGKVHGQPAESVHFHEVGATDAIVDIVAAAVAFESLEIENAISSPIATGFGMTKTEHGFLPLPSPAVAELLQGAPMYSANVQAELVTPTGAALITSMVSDFGELPSMVVSKVGYGAGSRELEHPNVLRVFLGERREITPDIVQLEATIDSADGELVAHVFERLFREGAVDAWTTPVYMKKCRPGIALTVLARPGEETALAETLLVEGITLGVRIAPLKRIVAEREIVTVETPYGRARAKLARYENRIVYLRPEHEDCRAIAEKQGISLETARRVVLETARRELGLE